MDTTLALFTSSCKSAEEDSGEGEDGGEKGRQQLNGSHLNAGVITLGAAASGSALVLPHNPTDFPCAEQCYF